MYNCSRTILRCVRSINAKDSEIIIVNDGSTDDSASIVTEYAKNYNNVYLINQRNQGVSVARNTGIKHAKGKYVCFVDADDYLSMDGLDRIVDIAEKEEADIVTYDAHMLSERDIPPLPESVKDIIIKFKTYFGRGEAFKTNLIPDYVSWDAIYLLSIIKNNNVYFKSDLVFREDDEFKGHFYCFTNKIIVSDLPLYNYITDSSSSSTATKNKRRTIIESSIASIEARISTVKENFEDEFPIERLKFMRYVSMPSDAIKAQYSLSEYICVLDRFRKLGCYPLNYDWIMIAQVKKYSKRYFKLFFKTFLTNHPRIGYMIYKILS